MILCNWFHRIWMEMKHFMCTHFSLISKMIDNELSKAIVNDQISVSWFQKLRTHCHSQSFIVQLWISTFSFRRSVFFFLLKSVFFWSSPPKWNWSMKYFNQSVDLLNQRFNDIEKFWIYPYYAMALWNQFLRIH